MEPGSLCLQDKNILPIELSPQHNIGLLKMNLYILQDTRKAEQLLIKMYLNLCA